MTTHGMLQIAIYFTALIASAFPLGRYMARVYSGEAVFLSGLAGPLERGIYRCCRIDREQEMTWKAYAGGLLIFNLTGCLAVYLLQRFQGFLPAPGDRFVREPLQKQPTGSDLYPAFHPSSEIAP